MQWETNKDFARLPVIAAGDIVHLKGAAGFTYVVKAIVSRVKSDRIEAVVEAVFDGSNQGQITTGDPLTLVGSTLSFTPQAVHKVIRRHDAV